MNNRFFEDETLGEILIFAMAIFLTICILVCFFTNKKEKKQTTTDLKNGDVLQVFQTQIDGHDYVVVFDKDNNRTELHLDTCRLCEQNGGKNE